MRSIRFVSIALLLSITVLPVLAGSLTPPGPPAPTMKALDVAEPRIPISSLPFTISAAGSYYLTKTLTFSGNGNGITVNASPVTIDLRGFSLEGDGVSVFSYAIAVGPDDVTITNGTIHNWGYGIWADQGGVHRLQGLTIRESLAYGAYLQDGFVHDCAFLFNHGNGLVTVGSSLIANSRFLGNALTGLQVRGERSIVENCILDANGDGGITLGLGGTIRHSIITGCIGVGILASGHTVVFENDVYSNSGDGIVTTGSEVRIEGNHVTSNGAYGIRSWDGGNLILRNSARANVLGNFSFFGSGTVAPIETGTITNPASNVSY